MARKARRVKNAQKKQQKLVKHQRESFQQVAERLRKARLEHEANERDGRPCKCLLCQAWQDALQIVRNHGPKP